MPIASTFAVIGPSVNDQRGPPAFFFRSASKERSRSQSSSTPCSSSGRSTLDPTAVNLVFSVTTIPPDIKRPSLHGTVGRTAVPPNFDARAPRSIPPLTVRLRPRLVTGDAGVLAEARGRWPLVRRRHH